MIDVGRTATLAHGISMDRVDRLAHDAARKATATRVISPTEAREEAWHAIVELIYSTTEKPSEWSMVEAGTRAIGEVARLAMRDQGLRVARDGTGGYVETPHFNAYWSHIVGAKPDWTDAIIERMALPHALGTLTPLQYQAIAALAAHGQLDKAADAVGATYEVAKQRVQAGRERILAVWFEHETPKGKLMKVSPDVACRHGHLRAEHSDRDATTGQWVCRRCKRNSARRLRARKGARTEHAVVATAETFDQAEVATPLTFAPVPEATPVGMRTAVLGGAVIGSNACWCGLPCGHSWDRKDEGAPHPPDSHGRAA